MMEALILGLLINSVQEFQNMKVVYFDGDSVILRDLRGLEWKVSIEQVFSEVSLKKHKTLTFKDFEKGCL